MWIIEVNEVAHHKMNRRKWYRVIMRKTHLIWHKITKFVKTYEKVFLWIEAILLSILALFVSYQNYWDSTITWSIVYIFILLNIVTQKPLKILNKILYSFLYIVGYLLYFLLALCIVLAIFPVFVLIFFIWLFCLLIAGASSHMRARKFRKKFKKTPYSERESIEGWLE